MFERALTLFRLKGIPIRLDASWVIIAVLVTWSLAAGFFPTYLPGLEGSYVLMGVAGALGLFVSIVFHEFCHAWIGGRHGVEIRSITLFVFGGVAEMRNEPPSPKAEFWMAVAGPIGSVVLACICAALYLTADTMGWAPPVVGVLFWLGWVNSLLAGFNLVPAFPLDGGRMLRALLWGWKKSLRRATRITSTMGSWFGALMIVLGVLAFLGGNFIGGAWWALLGLFLRGAARSSYQFVVLRRFLEGEQVCDFMKTDVVTVPPSLTVQQLVDEYVYPKRFRLYPVVEDVQLAGYVTVDHIEETDREKRDTLHVRDLIRPCNDEVCIAPDDDMLATLQRMQSTGNRRLLVVEDGSLRGIVTLRDVMERLALTLELEGEESAAEDVREATASQPPGPGRAAG